LASWNCDFCSTPN